MLFRRAWLLTYNNFEADEYLRALRENYPGTETDIFNDIDSRLAASPNKSDRR